MVSIKGWSRGEDGYVYPSGKAIAMNVAKMFPSLTKKVERLKTDDPEMLKKLREFRLGRTAFQNKSDDLCNFVDYFIENYDLDKEIPTAYLILKNASDDERYQLTKNEFSQIVYRRLFTPTIKSRIYRMVCDNYEIDVTKDGKTGRVYDADDDFTNEDAKRFLAISMMFKILIPPMDHYLVVSSDSYKSQENQSYIGELFCDAFYEIGAVSDTELELFATGEPTDIDVVKYERDHGRRGEKGRPYNTKDLENDQNEATNLLMKKLYRFVSKRVEKHSKNNALMWSQHAALRGLTESAHADRLIQKFVLYDNFFKFNFNDNIVSFLQSIVTTQLKFTVNIQKYKKDPIRLDDTRSQDGLSSIDKLEQSMVKIDETEIIKIDIAIRDTIKRLIEEVGPISEEEIDYYTNTRIGSNSINTNKFKNYLLENFFAKEFGGFSELHTMPERFYTILAIVAKRRMIRDGYKQMPFLITSAMCGKVSNRMLQNTKYITKLQSSDRYKDLMEKDYKALIGYHDDMIIDDESKILNRVYCFEEYEMPELTGKPICFDEDIISDEYMILLDNV